MGKRKRFMTSEIGPKSIKQVLDKLDDDVSEGIAAAMEIDASGSPQEMRARVVSALNEDAEALARLLLKIDCEIYDFVAEVVDKGQAKIGIMEVFSHPVSADLVSFLVSFFPEDVDKEGSEIRYFMPTDKGFGNNIRRLLADDEFLAKRDRSDGMRRFLRGVAGFYGAASRFDIDKVLDSLGEEAIKEFDFGAPISASEAFDFTLNGVVRHDFQLCIRNRPDGLGEYLMPVSAPENAEEEESLNGLLSMILEQRSGKPIKMPTVDDLMQLTNGCEYDYIDTDESNDLFDFLTEELGYDEDYALDIVGYAAMRVRIGADVEAVLKGLNEEFGFSMPSKKKRAEKFLALFCNYINSVPTWSNYGASPAEMYKFMGDSGDFKLKAFPVPGESGELPDDDCDEEDDDDYDDAEGLLPWEHGRSAEDTPAELLVPSVYPKGSVDFKWVKNPEVKRQRLEEYDSLRPVLMSYVYNIIRPEIVPEERESAEKTLGIGPDPEMDMDRVCTDFAISIQQLKGTNARLRVDAKRDEMTPAFQIAADYYANYSYTWLKVVAMKSGVGLKCVNLLSGEELFLMEKSLSMNPQIKGMTLCVGIAPMDGTRYVILGQGLLADFEKPERFLADTLRNLGIDKVPPCGLTPEEQEKLAVSTIRRIAANPLRIRIN